MDRFVVPWFNFKVSFLIKSNSSPTSFPNFQYPVIKGTFAENHTHRKSKQIYSVSHLNVLNQLSNLLLYVYFGI